MNNNLKHRRPNCTLFGSSFGVSPFPQAAFRCRELSTMFYMANVTKMLLFVSFLSSQLQQKPPPSCETHKHSLPKNPTFAISRPSKGNGRYETTACSSLPSPATVLLRGLTLVLVFPSALNSLWLPAPSAQFPRQPDTVHPRCIKMQLLL